MVDLQRALVMKNSILCVIGISLSLGLLVNCDYFKKNSLSNVNSSASDTQKSEEKYKYSPFFPGKSPSWMSYQESLAASKFGRIIEVSRYWDEQQTEAQKKAADEFYNQVLDSLRKKGWFDVEQAYASGYRLYEDRDSTHYENSAFLFDGEVLNPEKPEYLMFYETTEGIKLVGAMFIIESLTEHGDQFGGPETTWHFHDYESGVCAPVNIPEHMVKEYKLSKEGCDSGYLLPRSTEMLHVWIADHPEGRFATNMAIDEGFILSE